MKRKAVWIAVVVIVAVVAAAVLAVPAFINEQAIRESVESRLEAALGRDVTVTELDVRLFPAGLTARGLSVSEGDGQGSPVLGARSVSFGAELRPLLSGEVRVHAVEIREPFVELRRRPDGSWNVQDLVPKGTGSSTGGGSPDDRFEVSLDGVDVRDARIGIQDGGARYEVGIEALRLDVKSVTPKLQLGATRIHDAALALGAAGAADPLVVHLRDATLSAPPWEKADLRVSASLSGGGHSGDADVRGTLGPAAAGGLPLDLTVDARGLELQPFTKGRLSGLLTGQLGLAGRLTDPRALLSRLDGGGSVSVADGRLTQLDILGSVSQVAGLLGEGTLSGLSRRLASGGTEFERATSDVKLAGGILDLSDIVVEAPDFGLKGAVRANLASRALSGLLSLTFSEELSTSMQAEGSRAAELFWDARAGRVVMPLSVKGSLDQPQVSVNMGGAAGRAAVGSVLDKMLGKENEEEGSGGDGVGSKLKKLFGGN